MLTPTFRHIILRTWHVGALVSSSCIKAVARRTTPTRRNASFSTLINIYDIGKIFWNFDKYMLFTLLKNELTFLTIQLWAYYINGGNNLCMIFYLVLIHIPGGMYSDKNLAHLNSCPNKGNFHGQMQLLCSNLFYHILRIHQHHYKFFLHIGKQLLIHGQILYVNRKLNRLSFFIFLLNNLTIGC